MRWFRRSKAEELDPATAAAWRRASRTTWVAKTSSKLNDALARVERAFLLERGLAERPWFKHSIYAPGLTTGYACWPMPALRQALEESNYTRLAAELPLTVERIEKAAVALELARERAQAALMRRTEAGSTRKPRSNPRHSGSKQVDQATSSAKEQSDMTKFDSKDRRRAVNRLPRVARAGRNRVPCVVVGTARSARGSS